jgi:hypothetical protein
MRRIRRVFRFLKPSEKRVEGTKSAGNAPKSFHAVAVQPGLIACRAALKLAGDRFLSAEAPTLPLSDCDIAKCTCRYAHFEDRRHMQRRSIDHWESGKVWIGQERRGAPGRRSTDR